MFYIKENTIERISNWKNSSIHILTDFDRTITAGNNNSSWSALGKSSLAPKEYVEERQKLFDYYRPIELDESLNFDTKNKLMIEWWTKHIEILIKYKVHKNVVKEAVNDKRIMSFRKGAKEFLIKMNDEKIPVIIISAGVGNFIEEFLLKYDCYFENISILSNYIIFENDIAVGLAENIIHSLNKNETSIPSSIRDSIKDRPNIILLGDSISDIRMASEENRENALKIGFLEEAVEENLEVFKENYDVVCTEGIGFKELFKKLDILN